MSDFFESESPSLAADVLAREMRKEEHRYSQRSKSITAILAVLLAAAVLLGGGFAFASNRRPTPRAAVGAAAKSPIKSPKSKSRTKHASQTTKTAPSRRK